MAFALNRHTVPSHQQPPRRRWIIRALLISLTLSILSIDDPRHDVYLRRRLADDGEENDTAAAQAALTALEQALGVLDEIMAVQDGDGSPEDQSVVMSAAPAQDQVIEGTDQDQAIAVDQAVDEGETQTEDRMEVQTAQDQNQNISEQQTSDEQQQTDVQPAQETQDQPETASPQSDSDESIKKAAADALGEAVPRNHRDEAPQPVQSREKYL